MLRHAVPSFPTVSEVWLHLLEAYGLSQNGFISPTAGAALVCAGLLSVMIFSALAVSRLPKRVETAGARDRVAIHCEAM